MSLRRLALAALLAGVTVAARGENTSPRDIWGQAASAAMNGDVPTAVQKTNELFAAARGYGIVLFPAYASSAVSLAREADKLGRKDVADWAAKAAQQLDPRSPAVAFNLADRARARGNVAEAIRLSITGYGRVFSNYTTGLLARCDILLTLALALVLSAAVFAAALFIRYGRSASHDFRELLATRIHGGSVTVLAAALLLLPLFLWFGPIWLIFYWFVLFFGYAGHGERIIIGLLCLVIACLPVAVDRAASLVAGADNPIVQATRLSTDQSYRPESLHRIEELARTDQDIVHLLFGNLQLQEGSEQQAQVQYRRATELKDSAGAHVNLGNLHFLNNDFPAAITEYEKAEELDPKLAIAYYNNSLASGELYRFDEQGQKLEQAKKIDRSYIERLSQNPPPQKIVMYTPPIEQAWQVAEALARKGTAQDKFGTYSYFDPTVSARNPITIGSVATLIFAVGLWFWRRKTGYANSCIKCGRTFCHRCKSGRESATYCTQCIHIYLKRDGVSLETKRRKLEEVHEHQSGMVRRNKILAVFLPGSAQLAEGRTISGALGMFAFLFFVCFAVYVGRLAPALGPVAETAKLVARSGTVLLALLMWLILWVPVYRRKVTAG